LSKLRIEKAGREHAALVFSLLLELAVYERLSDSVFLTEELLREFLFGVRPVAEAILAWEDDQPAGFAVFYLNYSTFLGRPGIYLEDIFVKPEFRGKGIGRSLLTHIARLAMERGCRRLEWSVLDWNETAIGFYKSLGAKPKEGWTVYQLGGDALTKLANET
jgi:GNAT superfamily N-acetyltransferase